MINKKIILGVMSVLISIISYGAITGRVKNKNGKDYVVPFSREGRGKKRINEKGVQYKESFVNERDKSNEIIVYSDFNDEPAKHCKRKKGHSILRKNEITGEIERVCRLDTPGSRVEGSGIEVDEIQYYIVNTENKVIWEKTYKEKKNSIEKKVYSNDEYTKYAKYSRPDKQAELRAKYLEPKEEIQIELRELYKRKLFEQYRIEE